MSYKSNMSEVSLDWLDYGKKLFIKMKNNNCNEFHLFGHSWELDEYKEWDNLEIFFKFIKDNV